MTTHLQRARPHAAARHQRGGQRRDWRGYPDDGMSWGSTGWTPVVIPAPTLTTIAPTTWAAAAAATTVTLTGTGFVPDSRVEIAGVVVPTTYSSATQLTTSYDPSAAGTVQFTVRNPNGQTTVQKPFIVT